MTSSLLAEFNPSIIGLIVPVATLAFVICIVAIKKKSETERQRLWHETARLALEKGLPVPLQSAPNGDRSKTDPRDTIGRDVRAGLILIAVGVGLYFGCREMNFTPGLIAFYVPVFVGIALLLNAAFAAVTSRKHSDNDKPSHQS